ncbi:TetR/AcrR family transcriptional regulator [Sphingomonas paeninsulae]|nr:TetR/AcrR family transcriptional regulator [Sphingomonas paeninsulae]
MSVSQAVLALFVETGTTQFSVKQLAEHAGVSERTFYRYFPRKEDVVRPVLSAGASQLSDLLIHRDDSESLTVAISGAFAASWWADSPIESQTLRRLMKETEVFRAVWLDIIVETENRLAVALATRMAAGTGNARAKLMASIVCAVIRASVEGLDSQSHTLATVFSHNLDLVAAGLFNVEP